MPVVFTPAVKVAPLKFAVVRMPDHELRVFGSVALCFWVTTMEDPLAGSSDGLRYSL